ncbi:putative leucine-rich repeat receptor-like serine/threonine-protein kinase At2g19230 [Aristolochia californica]|uniref:putative leucine-rich repeat receptor-like serine/threonine-protein kinase At2g19230 n=1 Tax=Aristolochia californica TaxID=171875 RepID=UPI0035D77DF7
MKASFAPLTSSEIYQGYRTPSELSEFCVSSPECSLGSCSSAREIYQGLRTPDWSEVSQRSFDTQDVVEDEYPPVLNRRTIFAGVFSACFTGPGPGPELARRATIVDEIAPVVRGTVPALDGLTLESPHYTYDEIVRITNGFQNVCGRGKYGIVYPGQMMDGAKVAVKMFSKKLSESPVFCQEFKLQVQLSMTLKHKNLIPVVGHCYEGNRVGIVLEYMPRGNLSRILQGIDGNENPLSWVQRIQIAIDIAQGLEYLHFGCNPPIIHGNMKMTNILLDERLEAKLTDFWFNKALFEAFSDFKKLRFEAFSDFEKLREEEEFEEDDYVHPATFWDSEILRNIGYTDVLQFGWILLELITGQPERMSSKNKLVDPRLQGNYNAESASKVLNIATECQAKKSLTMSDVVVQLKSCL